MDFLWQFILWCLDGLDTGLGTTKHQDVILTWSAGYGRSRSSFLPADIFVFQGAGPSADTKLTTMDMIIHLIGPWWRHKVTQNLVNIDSGNGLLPDNTKPLSETMLTYQLILW